MDYTERLYPNSVVTGGIRLHCCGRRLNAENHCFGPASRENYWIIYLEEGSGEYTINKKTFPLKKDMLFVGFPNCPISYRADPGVMWSIRWVCIGSDMLSFLFRSMGITPDSPVMLPKQPKAVRNTLTELFDATAVDTVNSNISCMRLVYSLLSLMTEDGQRLETGQDYIDNAIRFMKHSYDKNIRIDDVAAYVNLERGYFSKLFQKRIGISPRKWLIAFRMEKASLLLHTTDLTIGEIALSVGYDDQLYFSRLFRAAYGVTPTAHRAEKESDYEKRCPLENSENGF